MLQQFYTRADARAAMNAMDEYVEAVQKLNATLLKYNALVTEYLRLQGEHRATLAQQEQLNSLITANANPHLFAETAFVSALYNRAPREVHPLLL